MPSPPAPEHCRVVELRQYTLHPGRRDTLITLFEREFIEPQEAAGIAVLGQFRDLDDADRFVWWRGFADLPARTAALQAFYGGPAWQAHREAANATMIDSDNVLLLRPHAAHAPLVAPGMQRASHAATASPRGMLLVTLCALPPGTQEDFGRFFARELAPALRATGGQPFGVHVSEPGPNHFTRLPVREGENVFLWCSLFAGPEDGARHEHARNAHPGWQLALQQLQGPAQYLRLAPTPRSLIHL